MKNIIKFTIIIIILAISSVNSYSQTFDETKEWIFNKFNESYDNKLVSNEPTFYNFWFEHNPEVVNDLSV